MIFGVYDVAVKQLYPKTTATLRILYRNSQIHIFFQITYNIKQLPTVNQRTSA